MLFKPTAAGSAPLAATLDTIMDFMVESGMLKAAEPPALEPSAPKRPVAADLLDPSILELITDDVQLSAIAHGEPPP